jgi:hypothetical protein
MVKVVPCPISLCTSMVPPCPSTSVLVIANPRPIPLALVVNSDSAHMAVFCNLTGSQRSLILHS